MIAIAPIAILLIIVGMAIVMMKRQPGKNRYMNYVKRTKWMLGGYLAILIISVGVFFILPKGEDEDLLAKKMDMSEATSPNLYEAADKGRITKFDQYAKKRWEFNAKENTIHLQAPNGTDLAIFVETKKTQAKMIEVIYYQGPVIVRDLDMTDRTNSPTVEFLSGNMSIYDAKPLELRYTMFKQEFPFMQFTGEKWLDNDLYFRGGELLYIRIPESTELTTSPGVFIEYVGEEE